MAHKLRSHLIFVQLTCLIFLSLYSSFSAPASLLHNSPMPFYQSLQIWASAAHAFSVQKSRSYACYPPDRDALLDFAASSSTSGLQWRHNETDCCDWEGITCGTPFNSTTELSTNGNRSTSPKLYSRVVGLMLADNSTTDYRTTAMILPLAICRLSALNSLDLSWNRLITPIPACFGHNLSSLQTLILSGNDLSGSLCFLANLSLLTHLDLSFNKFASVQAFSIIFSSSLTYLNLSSNRLSGSLSALEFHNPCNLEYLDLSYNSLSGSVVSFIKALPTNLRHLDLSYNDLSIFLSPGGFGTTPLLQQLKLDGNKQIAGDVRVLEHLRYLEKLSLEMLVPAHSLGSLLCELRSLQSLSWNAWQEVKQKWRPNEKLADSFQWAFQDSMWWGGWMDALAVQSTFNIPKRCAALVADKIEEFKSML